MGRRRPPALLDWVKSYDVLDARNSRLYTVSYAGRARAMEAICRALHDLTQGAEAQRVRFVSVRGRTRSFNLRTLVAHLELIQGGAGALKSMHDAIPWLSSLLAGWDAASRKAHTSESWRPSSRRSRRPPRTTSRPAAEIGLFREVAYLFHFGLPKRYY